VARRGLDVDAVSNETKTQPPTLGVAGIDPLLEWPWDSQQCRRVKGGFRPTVKQWGGSTLKGLLVGPLGTRTFYISRVALRIVPPFTCTRIQSAQCCANPLCHIFDQHLPAFTLLTTEKDEVAKASWPNLVQKLRYLSKLTLKISTPSLLAL
jgi:hypothetical protein